ncbi:MAG TPA: S8 family serine peptidase [Thermoanaerobaculia bacterium]|nr:S8 family serine peptidase [Thermoanaerobaculia bacterium]
MIGKALTHSITVIVGLKLDHEWVPEGYLAREDVSKQRAAIDTALARLKTRYIDKMLDIQNFSPIPYACFVADVGLLQRLDHDDEVTSIELNELGSVGLRQSAPLVGATAAWSAGYDGTGQTIAIVDTGIDKTHPFLSGKVVAEACSSNPEFGVSSSTVCPNGQTQMVGTDAGVNCNVSISGCSHGTHVAGIAAGSSTTDGIWGIARGAKLISVQVFHRVDDQSVCLSFGDSTPCAETSVRDIAAGLNQVADFAQQFQIAAVNISIQFQNFFSTREICRTSQPAVGTAIQNLRSRGIAVVGITGNYGNKSALAWPGCIPGVIDVGASTKDDAVAGFSDSTSELDLLAPGDGNATHPGITSSVPGGGYAAYWGTSMAAPHVAGALAILRQKSPSASAGLLLSDLATTGVLLSDPQNQVTKPRINILAALSADHTPPSPPGSLVAAPTAPTSVSLSWTASSDEHGIGQYSVQRRSFSTASFIEVGTSTSLSYADTSVAANSTYQYQIKAVDTSGNMSAASNSVRATTILFSDDPLMVLTTSIRGVHVTELRSAVDSLRTFASLSAATWTDSVPFGIIIKATHIQELRDRLGEALSALGITPPPYTDPSLSPGVSIKGIHVVEIRRNTK